MSEELKSFIKGSATEHEADKRVSPHPRSLIFIATCWEHTPRDRLRDTLDLMEQFKCTAEVASDAMQTRAPYKYLVDKYGSPKKKTGDE